MHKQTHDKHMPKGLKGVGGLSYAVWRWLQTYLSLHKVQPLPGMIGGLLGSDS